ncbi:MAG: site-specific integrase [Nostoc sp.]|uniref:site-specific integrase n=1 Tax=Nostoc sp. TaxID=1180 RepID=UPI002FF859A8
MQECPNKLLEQVQDTIRLKDYSYKIEKSYIDWIRRYIFFDDKRHSKDMESAEIEAFLTHLAVKENVTASTQNPS